MLELSSHKLSECLYESAHLNSECVFDISSCSRFPTVDLSILVCIHAREYLLDFSDGISLTLLSEWRKKIVDGKLTISVFVNQFELSVISARAILLLLFGVLHFFFGLDLFFYGLDFFFYFGIRGSDSHDNKKEYDNQYDGDYTKFDHFAFLGVGQTLVFNALLRGRRLSLGWLAVYRVLDESEHVHVPGYNTCVLLPNFVL